MSNTNLTIVTGLFDLGRGQIGTDMARSFEHYKECFSRLLKIKHLQMVIFCEPELESFIWQYRDRENTRLIFKTLDDLRRFPFYEDVQKIRNDSSWRAQAGWLDGSTQARLELYNPLVMSKQFMLNDASLHNHFNSTYFLWVDAGISNTVSIEGYMNETFEKRIIKHLNKMLYLCFPYDGQVEVHGFEKQALNRYSGKNTEWVARGGIFGGPKHLINEINNIYYGLLNDTMKSGFMGTEESIFTIITYKHPDKCNLRMINNDGLVYKFFEDIQNEKVNTSDAPRLAIYCLTYNLPQQFKLWVENFNKVTSEKNYAKYVINNSTDPSVQEEYQKLFAEHGFTEIKFDNVGINGGRFQAAKHFDESDHEYMIFFEDDMMLCDSTYKDVCKNGFNRWYPDLFEKSIEVLDFEKLDYLKLSFSEFFGDNHINWAHFNVPEVDRLRLFPDRNDDVDKFKTKIDYTGSYRQLPYIVGYFHYCNWPILFNKSGNRKVFLDVVWEHPHEQTWMSYVLRDLIVPGKLKVGSLLATTIDHQRVFFYANRRENQHYK